MYLTRVGSISKALYLELYIWGPISGALYLGPYIWGPISGALYLGPYIWSSISRALYLGPYIWSSISRAQYLELYIWTEAGLRSHAGSGWPGGPSLCDVVVRESGSSFNAPRETSHKVRTRLRRGQRLTLGHFHSSFNAFSYEVTLRLPQRTNEKPRDLSGSQSVGDVKCYFNTYLKLWGALFEGRRLEILWMKWISFM